MVYQKCLKLSINTVYTDDFGNLNLSRRMVISVISNLIFFAHVDLCEAKTYWELCSGLDVERPYPDRRCISVAIPGGVMSGMSVKVFCLMPSAFNVPNLPNISWEIFGRLQDLLLKSGWPKNMWMVSQKTKRFWEESRIVAATLLPVARTFIFADSWRGSTNSAWFFVLWLRWGSFFPKASEMLGFSFSCWNAWERYGGDGFAEGAVTMLFGAVGVQLLGSETAETNLRTVLLPCYLELLGCSCWGARLRRRICGRCCYHAIWSCWGAAAGERDCGDESADGAVTMLFGAVGVQLLESETAEMNLRTVLSPCDLELLGVAAGERDCGDESADGAVLPCELGMLGSEETGLRMGAIRRIRFLARIRCNKTLKGFC